MMQQSRQLDPSLLVKQQTPPSQQQPLHQPAMKSFLENVMPHTTPELQKGPSPINAFSNFPIGGFLTAVSIQLMLRGHGLTVSSPRAARFRPPRKTMLAPGPFLPESCLASCRFTLGEGLSPCKKITLFPKFPALLQQVRIKVKSLLSHQVASS